MSQSGYTPILIYASGTATNVPLAANLTSSASGAELALNYADGKLYYKDSGGVVQVLASKAGSVNVSSFSAGTTGFTPSTATTGVVTLAGTLITSNGGTGLSSYTAGDLSYYASGTALTKLAIGTNGYVLQSNGTAPTWVAASTVVGGAAGSNTQIQFNNAGALGASSSLTWSGTVLATTGLTATGAILHNTTTNNQSYTTTGAGTITISSGTTGTIDGMNIGATTAGTGRFSSITNTGLTSGRVVYSTTGGLETDSANLTFNGTTLTANTIGAFTLSGTIAGGGNQINNVIIGTSTPLAGAFTTLSASTSITNTGLTSGRVVYSTTGGLETDSAGLTFDGTNFATTGTATAAKLIPTGTSVTGNGMYLPATNSVGISTAGTNAVYIDASQNVGIGTTSPSTGTLNRQLTINSGASSLAGVVMQNNASGTAYNDGFTIYLGGADASLINYETGALSFGTSAIERMRIDSSGNLLVGTANASPSAGNGFKISSTGRAYSVITTADSDSYNLYNTTAGAYRFFVTAAGVVNATTTTITAISDQRLKENVRDIDTGLDTIMALKPRRFDWKEGKGQDKKNVAGFIAQEFEEIFPESVGVSKAGEDGIEYKNINHETLIPTFVKAIQEQQALITSLTARIEALEAK